jgi:hypothetical protein
MKNTGKQKRRLPAKAKLDSAHVPTFAHAPAPVDHPSLTQTKTLLAQVHLHDVEEELADLRKTLGQHRAALNELRKNGDLPPGFIKDLLVALDRRDRQLSTRLAKVQDTVTDAIHLLASANDIDLVPANN